MKAIDLIGAKLGINDKVSFFLKGRLGEAELDQVNQAKDNETLRLEVKAVIINKYHYIRDYRHDLGSLMCRFYNKQAK